MDDKKTFTIGDELSKALYKLSYGGLELEECKAIAAKYGPWLSEPKFSHMGVNDIAKK